MWSGGGGEQEEEKANHRRGNSGQGNSPESKKPNGWENQKGGENGRARGGGEVCSKAKKDQERTRLGKKEPDSQRKQGRKKTKRKKKNVSFRRGW